MKVSIVGTGVYGIALANSIAKNNTNVVMWSENKSLVESFKKTHELKSILDVKIMPNITLTNSYKELLVNTSLIIIVTANKYISSVTKDMKKFYNGKIPVCIASKGIDEKELCLLSDVVKKNLKTNDIAVISGPTFAIDLANDDPVALALGYKNIKTRNIVKEVLQSDRLKLRPTKDMKGIQLCGSLKNIIAIASGILKGLGYKESSQAFLINESLHDIEKIIYELGGSPRTILSFAGVGDITLTCTSTKSRNYSFGYVIGSTKSKEKIDEYLKNNTVEGYHTLKAIHDILESKNIKSPLINTIYNIVYNNEDPYILVDFLIEKE